jgi:cytochrome bd-type quinol oxidase subunit 1
MAGTLFWSRLLFAFTVTYHYLMTMGLARIIVYFKWRYLRTGE